MSIHFYTLENKTIVGFQLNTSMMMQIIEDHVGNSDAAYDYIMDEEFNDELAVYFPDAPKDIQMFKKDIPCEDPEFYIGYIRKEKGIVVAQDVLTALSAFQGKYNTYLANKED